MLVLFETPAGYALFKLLDKAKLAKPEDVFKHFDTPEHASQVCVHTTRQQQHSKAQSAQGRRARHSLQRCAMHSGWRGSLCGISASSSLRACASLLPPLSCAGGVRITLSTHRQTATAVHACNTSWQSMCNVVQTAVCAVVHVSRPPLLRHR
jgi:hypothetical protein